VVAKDALDVTPPFVLAFLRVGLAALVFALVVRGRAPRRPQNGAPAAASRRLAASCPVITRSPLHRLTPSPVWVGVLAFGLGYCFYFLGLSRTTATAAALLVNTEAAFTAALGGILLGERLERRGWAGMGLASAGAALILMADRLARGGEVRLLGNLLVLGAALSQAAATVMSRRLRSSLTGLALTGTALRWGALFLLLPALVQWRGAGYSHAWLTPRSLLQILYLSLISTVACYGIWYGLLDRVQAGSAAAFLCLQPLAAVLLAELFRGERLLPVQAGGGALVLLGLLLVSTAGPRKGEERASAGSQ
jgi:drug/metabolite transporter (DMT)-like permease